MRSAARAWGRQLDARSSGAGARHRGLARGGILGGRKPDSLPAALPWAPGGTPRFACDTNLEGLARQLRMCGLDATSAPPGGANRQRFLIHRWLVEVAEREARLVLTTDRVFVGARHTGACLLVTAPDKKAQLAQVLAALGIAVPEGRLLSRCAACNGEFGARRAHRGHRTCAVQHSMSVLIAACRCPALSSWGAAHARHVCS